MIPDRSSRRALREYSSLSLSLTCGIHRITPDYFTLPADRSPDICRWLSAHPRHASSAVVCVFLGTAARPSYPVQLALQSCADRLSSVSERKESLHAPATPNVEE
ncbi:hypothetical protein VTH06DRAFT_6338 [Thermothelomyces fergusii]